MLQSFLTRTRSLKYSNLLIFSVFWGGVLLQCVLFNWLAFRSIAVSSLWRNPLYFWSFYLPKLSIAMLIGCGVFLFKRKYWTIYFSVLLNIWILAEVVYYRSTHILLDYHSIMLLKFLHGFESSIGMYMTPDLLLLLIPTALIAIAVWLFDNRRREWKPFGICLAVSAALTMVGVNLVKCNHPEDKNRYYVSYLQSSYINRHFDFSLVMAYTSQVSVVHAFLYCTTRLIASPFQSRYKIMTPEDLQAMAPFVDTTAARPQPSHPLVLILVESLEGWAIKPDVVPNMYRFMQSHNVIWATSVTNQTKGGNSADGQMIFNTGILPIEEGTVCNIYQDNVFPSLSDCYDSTALVMPGDLSVWNQVYMNIAYHIDTPYENRTVLDHISFHILDSIIGQYDYILAITMATHSPFQSCAHYSSLSLPDDMPENMRNYLLSMNYTDSCWGHLLERIDTDSVLHNSVVCFMGDHIIFDPIMRQEFQSYCDKKGLDFTPREGYTAFVGYSPDLQQSVTVTEPTYQMDVYPTILNMIGATDYYWKGFGVNLMDTAALHHRPITEQQAYMLSDKLIRADYFRTK